MWWIRMNQSLLQPYWKASEEELVRTQAGWLCREVTPHLGYLTNWHSLIQSVKLSLSNTLSGGPDRHGGSVGDMNTRRQLFRANTDKSPFKHAHALCCSDAKVRLFCAQKPRRRPTRVPPELVPAGAHVGAARTHRSSASHCAGDQCERQASTRQRRSQNKEDKRQASSQEICGNKVSPCHSCEMLAARGRGDNGQFVRLFFQSYCCARRLLLAVVEAVCLFH